MAKLFPFKPDDVIRNRIKTYPRTEYFVSDQHKYLNNMPTVTGSHVTNVGCVETGRLLINEENVDRESSQLINPFIIKDGTLVSLKTVSMNDYYKSSSYGDIISGAYPLSVTYQRNYYAANSERDKIDALRNTLNSNMLYSGHYAYSSSFGDKSVQEANLLEFSRLFYGSSIRPGSIDFKFHISGSLIGQLRDVRKNGELIQVAPAGSLGSGSVAGVALYKEGCILLTGAWSIVNEFQEPYVSNDATLYTPKWVYFASSGSAPAGGHDWNLPSSSFSLAFEGVNYVNTITMFAHARMGELNYSPNPTWIKYGQALTGAYSGSKEYVEWNKREIKNIVKTKWAGNPTGSFVPTTFIKTVNIHDEEGKIIARARLATPVRKTEDRGITIKMKIDLA